MQDATNCSIKQALADAEALLRQSRGHFDPDTLFLRPQTKSQPVMVNYVGPVEVIYIPGK